MSKPILIVGFAGIGKTYLAKKYDNVLDLDHLHYKYIYPEEVIKNNTFEQLKGRTQNREKNPLWPENYFKVLFENLEKYNIILLPASQDIIAYLDKINFEYILCYPKLEYKSIYMKRYKDRGTNIEWINKMERNFAENISNFELKKTNKIIMEGENTIEDELKKRNYI